MTKHEPLFLAIDEFIESKSIAFKSLNPAQDKAHSFQLLGRKLQEDYPDYPYTATLAGLCLDIIKAQIRHYPQNVFYDMDFMVHECVRMSLQQENGHAFLLMLSERLQALMATFGKETKISFQYVHDFSYGFDWAKWVGKSPEHRKNIGAFDPLFLDYLQSRGKEMLALIEVNDEKYAPLKSGEKYRNPFSFARTPAEETTLMRSLFAQNLIPLPLWDWDGVAVWDKDYQAERKIIAERLQK